MDINKRTTQILKKTSTTSKWKTKESPLSDH